jgi:hypothetical protein
VRGAGLASRRPLPCFYRCWAPLPAELAPQPRVVCRCPSSSTGGSGTSPTSPTFAGAGRGRRRRLRGAGVQLHSLSFAQRSAGVAFAWTSLSWRGGLTALRVRPSCCLQRVRLRPGWVQHAGCPVLQAVSGSKLPPVLPAASYLPLLQSPALRAASQLPTRLDCRRWVSNIGVCSACAQVQRRANLCLLPVG